MPPESRKVLHYRDLLLWKEMLLAVDYPDMGVYDEMISGSCLTGETDPTGVRPARKPGCMTEQDLFEVAARERPLLSDGSQFCPFMDEHVRKSVWESTLREVQIGALIGPIPAGRCASPLPTPLASGSG